MRRIVLGLSLFTLSLSVAPLASAQAVISAPARAVAYMPYVQAGTTTSMTVMWRSPAVVSPKLAIRDSAGRLLYEVPGPQGDEHIFRLTNLKPGTAYRYAAYENGKQVGEGTFHTNPGPETTKFRFVVMGDSGSGNANQASIAKRIEGWDPAFVLHVGDVVYEKGDWDQYPVRFMAPYHDLIENTVIYPTPGNHDYGRGNLDGYLRFFEVPRARPEDQEHWYTFSYGDVQFFAMDSNIAFGPGSPQYQWLSKELAASKAPWKIAYFHHPMYSSGEHGSSHTLRQAWGPLFEKYNVQLVFQGHDHHYERIKPQEAFVRDGVPTNYWVTGGAGAWLRGVHPQPFSAYTQSVYHFMGLTVTDHAITAEAIGRDGVVIDRYTVTR